MGLKCNFMFCCTVSFRTFAAQSRMAVSIVIRSEITPRGRFGFDSIDLCRCKHVVRCVVST